MNKKFYITTTLPYVNAEPHIGFALEIVQADVIARYHKEILKEDVVFNFGTDEHGQKIYQKALEQHKDPKIYCDEYAAKFDDLKKAFNLSYTSFIRTTDSHHIKAAREFWRRCAKNGDIYKKNYKIKYCVGCELEKTESELVNGRCQIHPNLKPEIIEEENYFFRFSRYQKQLLDLYGKHPDFVIPEGKFNEIKAFVNNGLEDFSVSRLKSKMPWGIEVPDDPKHVMYVWFDALINYISTLGWPEDEKNFSDFWPGIQVAGKDNLRQQTAMWQAMLLSAGLANSKQVFIHGFLTVDGQKISKSLGNSVNPIALAEKYGTDVLRYFLLAHIHPWDDSDFSIAKLEDAYNSNLANGVGNLAARIAKLAESSGLEFDNLAGNDLYNNEYSRLLAEFRFDEILKHIWSDLKILDQMLEEKKPWSITNKDILKKILQVLIDGIRLDARDLRPFLPETADKILEQFKGPKIKARAPLFPRIK
jgi:methionyl-tRNA synthetase